MISHKEISNKEVIQEVFSLINEFQELNAFITLNEENSIKKAEELDNNPSDLPLAGIPIAQLMAIGCGIFLAILTPILKRLMHGAN